MHHFDIIDKINQVANLSHPVDAKISNQSIDLSISDVALDRDIILDIDLPEARPKALITIEQDPDTSTVGLLIAFTPRLADFLRIYEGHDDSNTEFIFIGMCHKRVDHPNHEGTFTPFSLFSGLFWINGSRKSNSSSKRGHAALSS